MSAIEEAQQIVEGVEGSEDWIAVASEHESEGWDWSAISFFYSPSARRYFWFSDGGCSCNWHMDGPLTLGDFEHGDRQAAIKAAHTWGGDELAAEVRRFNYKVNKEVGSDS